MLFQVNPAYFFHRVSFHRHVYLMGVMDQPVEDGVNNDGITKLFMPVLDGQLTGDDGGSMTMP
jgi:hypothetical protein